MWSLAINNCILVILEKLIDCFDVTFDKHYRQRQVCIIDVIKFHISSPFVMSCIIAVTIANVISDVTSYTILLGRFWFLFWFYCWHLMFVNDALYFAMTK
jgi:hypothetical protein